MYVNRNAIGRAAAYYLETLIHDGKLRSRLHAELHTAQLDVRESRGRFTIELVLPSFRDDEMGKLAFDDCSVYLVNKPGASDMNGGPVVHTCRLAG